MVYELTAAELGCTRLSHAFVTFYDTCVKIFVSHGVRTAHLPGSITGGTWSVTKDGSALKITLQKTNRRSIFGAKLLLEEPPKAISGVEDLPVKEVRGPCPETIPLPILASLSSRGPSAAQVPQPLLGAAPGCIHDEAFMARSESSTTAGSQGRVSSSIDAAGEPGSSASACPQEIEALPRSISTQQAQVQPARIQAVRRRGCRVDVVCNDLVTLFVAASRYGKVVNLTKLSITYASWWEARAALSEIGQ